MNRIIYFILILIFPFCRTVSHITLVEESNINVAEVSSDQEVEQMIAPYKGDLDQEMNTEIGTCLKTLTKRKPESTLGNWFL